MSDDKQYDERVIGIIWRHGYNDYEYIIGDFPEKMRDQIAEMVDQFDNGYNLGSERGDKHLTLKDANIEHFERAWGTDEDKNKIIQQVKDCAISPELQEMNDEEIWETITTNPTMVIQELVNQLEYNRDGR